MMVLAQDLRDAVLQAAMQGKLTEQLATDSSVEKLLEEIKPTLQPKQNRTKIKSKQMNIELFDIPNSWKWVKLSECGNTNIGLTYSPQNQVIDSGIIVLRSSNIQNGKMDYSDIVRVDMKVPENKMCHIGDILICARNGSKKLVGKSALIDKEGMAFGAFMAVYRSKCNPYISYVINSPHFRKSVLGGAETITINQVTQDMIENYTIPLPPIEEQRRIVERVNALMAQIDEYEKTERELARLKADFPGDMKAAILQAAMQGKLTEQLDTDGSVDELFEEIKEEKETLIEKGELHTCKKYNPVSEDEVPFDIPANWQWVHLADVVKMISAGGDKPKNFSPVKTIEYQVEVIANGETNKGVLGYTDKATVSESCLTVSGRGTIGYSVIRNMPFVPIVRLLVIFPLKKTNLQYMQFALSTFLEYGSGTAVKQLTVPMISSKIIPFPPLEEQQRIVDRLDALLPLCENL